MQITRGDYDVIPFIRMDENDNVIKDIPEKVYFTVKKDANDKDALLQKTLGDGITIDENFNYNIEFTPDDTNNLSFGLYVYDICIKNGDKPSTIHKGYFEVTYEVTHKNNEV